MFLLGMSECLAADHMRMLDGVGQTPLAVAPLNDLMLTQYEGRLFASKLPDNLWRPAWQVRRMAQAARCCER